MLEKYILIVDHHQRKNNKQVFFDKQYKNDMCKNAWQSMTINQHGDVYLCVSPAWLPKSIGNILDYDNIYDLLNTSEAKKIRQTILNAQYLFCNSNICVHLRKASPPAIKTVNELSNDDIIKYDSVTSNYEWSLTDGATVTKLPKEIVLDFDYTCNFVCPSCRTTLINVNKTDKIINTKIVNKIKTLILDNCNSPTIIRWAGGEPFISDAYIKLWEYIVETQNYNIRNIIQTNGSYIKKKSKLFIKMLPYINEIWVSFDAGTEKTYNKVRVNGVWETLIDNVKFIRKQFNEMPGLVKYRPKLISSFVVQKDNYLEIPDYVTLVKNIGVDIIQLSLMWNWGTWSDQDFKKLNVGDKNHPEHHELINILRKVKKDHPNTKLNIGWNLNDPTE